MNYGTMTAEELQTMTVAQLESVIADINDQRAVLKAQAVEVHRLLDERNVQASAAKKLATLSDAEKAALVQMIQVQSMASNGQIGAVAI